jgi:hypothetical protein
MFVDFAAFEGTRTVSATAPPPEAEPRITVTRRGRQLIRLDDLAIPEQVQVADDWPEQMVEMADHIGAYRTLLLVERFGGLQLNIPADFTKGKTYEERGSIRSVIGDEAARILSHVYRRERLDIPRAKTVLSRAKRAGLVAAARSRLISVSTAAAIVGTTRRYMTHLVRSTSEGVGVAPAVMPVPREAAILRNAAGLAADALNGAGAAAMAHLVAERIWGLGDEHTETLRGRLADGGGQ